MPQRKSERTLISRSCHLTFKIEIFKYFVNTWYPSTSNSNTMSTYSELAPGSLKAAKVEHGLQTGAIYWEVNLNTYNGAFGTKAYPDYYLGWAGVFI